jgi:hypothetical protein
MATLTRVIQNIARLLICVNFCVSLKINKQIKVSSIGLIIDSASQLRSEDRISCCYVTVLA